MPRQPLVRFEVDKLSQRRLLAKLTGGSLYGAELRRTLSTTIEEGAVRVQSRAPLGRTSTLWASVDHAMDPSPIPLWAKITADASNAGFRYGRALQASKRIRYRYRHGPRTGRLTRRWFSGARPWIRKRLEQRLTQTAKRIESRWRR